MFLEDFYAAHQDSLDGKRKISNEAQAKAKADAAFYKNGIDKKVKDQLYTWCTQFKIKSGNIDYITARNLEFLAGQLNEHSRQT